MSLVVFAHHLVELLVVAGAACYVGALWVRGAALVLRDALAGAI